MEWERAYSGGGIVGILNLQRQNSSFHVFFYIRHATGAMQNATGVLEVSTVIHH